MTDPLAPLRRKFRARTAADRDRLAVLAGGDPTATALQRLVHSLAGAAGTFGFAELSRVAMEIDELYTTGQSPDPYALDRLDAAMQRVVHGPD